MNFSPEVKKEIEAKKAEIVDHMQRTTVRWLTKHPTIFVGENFDGSFHVGWIYKDSNIVLYENHQPRLGSWGDKDFKSYQFVWQYK